MALAGVGGGGGGWHSPSPFYHHTGFRLSWLGQARWGDGESGAGHRQHERSLMPRSCHPGVAGTVTLSKGQREFKCCFLLGG